MTAQDAVPEGLSRSRQKHRREYSGFSNRDRAVAQRRPEIPGDTFCQSRRRGRNLLSASGLWSAHLAAKTPHPLRGVSAESDPRRLRSTRADQY